MFGKLNEQDKALATEYGYKVGHLVKQGKILDVRKMNDTWLHILSQYKGRKRSNMMMLHEEVCEQVRKSSSTEEVVLPALAENPPAGPAEAHVSDATMLAYGYKRGIDY